MRRRDLLKAGVGLSLARLTHGLSAERRPSVAHVRAQTPAASAPRIEDAFDCAFPLYEFARTAQDRRR
jgi:hypothetical protein